MEPLPTIRPTLARDALSLEEHALAVANLLRDVVLHAIGSADEHSAGVLAGVLAESEAFDARVWLASDGLAERFRREDEAEPGEMELPGISPEGRALHVALREWADARRDEILTTYRQRP